MDYSEESFGVAKPGQEPSDDKPVDHRRDSPPQAYQLSHDYLVPVIRDWIRQNLGPFERLKQWCKRRPEAPKMIAGAYMMIISAAFLG